MTDERPQRPEADRHQDDMEWRHLAPHDEQQQREEEQRDPRNSMDRREAQMPDARGARPGMRNVSDALRGPPQSQRGPRPGVRQVGT